IRDGVFVAGGEDVGPAIIIVVEGPAGEAGLGPVNAHGLRNVRKGAVAVVAIQPGAAPQVEEKVWVAVVVEVDPGATSAPVHIGWQTGARSYVFKGTVALIAIQAAGLLFTTKEQVQKAIIVEVGPGTEGGVHRMIQARFPGDIGEGAIAVVP